MNEFSLKVKNGKIVSIVVDGISLRLKEPIPLGHSSEVIETAYMFFRFFDLLSIAQEILKQKPQIITSVFAIPSVNIGKLSEILLSSILKSKKLEKKYVINVLAILLSKDYVSKEELLAKSSILNEAKKRNVNPSKFLAGVIAGLNRRSLRLGLGKIIEKTSDGRYHIPEHLRNILSKYYNTLKKHKQA